MGNKFIDARYMATPIQENDEPAAEDFADCLIEAHNRRRGGSITAIFDVKAAKLATFMVLRLVIKRIYLKRRE